MAGRTSRPGGEKTQTPGVRPRWGPAIVLLAVFLMGGNALYQVSRRPSQLVGPLDGAFYKNPLATWEAHEAHFRRYSTELVPPELLAALAQAESRGNPIARTPWVWRWSTNPLEWYAPASSAAGLFQITDGTFALARKYCVRHGKIHYADPWFDLTGCWFNSLYTRLLPSHATELTAAYLHVTMSRILQLYRQKFLVAMRRSKEQDGDFLRADLGALIHLCGAARGEAFAKRGFRLDAEERCGEHNAAEYLARVRELRAFFRKLADSTP